jgi:lipid A ethanolaminephosphotransferase
VRPARLAPTAQKHIPLLFWLSPNYQSETNIDIMCLARYRRDPASHDNLFHTVLGLMDVETRAYDASLDLTALCRSTGAAAKKSRATAISGVGFLP